MYCIHYNLMHRVNMACIACFAVCMMSYGVEIV
jgi:hypothetical protein